MTSVFSDLHLCFQPVSGKTISDYICKDTPKEVNICILDGDIGMIKNHTTINTNPLLNELKKFCDRFEYVIYVHGNHEYYRNTITQGQKDFQKKVLSKLSNLHWLNNDVVVIEGQRFLGCTLWAKVPEPTNIDPVKFSSTLWKAKHYQKFNCFDQIGDLATIIESEHDKSVSFIKNNLQNNDVLITHFPAVSFVGNPKFNNDKTNWYYRNNLDEFILGKDPKLVISGHSHHSVDRKIGETRFLTNPFGYFRREENQEFKTDLTVEI